MPPTLAAAINTTCGRFAANQPVTAVWSHKSSSRRSNTISPTSSLARRRTSALPTMPRCPATNTDLPFRSNGVFAIGNLPPRDRKIACHHFLHELGQTGFWFPAELLPRLAGIADQQVHFGRAEVGRIDPNDRLAGFPVCAGFLHALAAPFDAAADFGKRQLDELPYRTRFTGRQHEIAGLVGLQYPVHDHDIISRVATSSLLSEFSRVERCIQHTSDSLIAAPYLTLQA